MDLRNPKIHPAMEDELLWISCRHGIAALKGDRGEYLLLVWNQHIMLTQDQEQIGL